MSNPIPSATNERIKILYEECNMTIDEIAADEGVDVEAVKIALMAHSVRYREENRKSNEEISDEEYKMILQGYKHLALGSDNDHIREKASRFLIEEKKGRNDARVKNLQKNVLGAGVVNVLLLQQAFTQVKKAKQKILGNGSPEFKGKGVVDVIAEPVEKE